MLYISKRSARVVVVAHQAMVVVLVGRNFLNGQASFLHGRATVRKISAEFQSGLLNRGVETEGRGFGVVDPVVSPIPDGFRTEDLARPLNDPEISFGHGRASVTVVG